MLAVAAAALLSGCVYYNGMYNTNRLVKSARKAERDGRRFEAQNLWGQVVTRADTLVARHPHSKYADQAQVLRGLALARLGQCPDAVGPLSRLELVSLSPPVEEEAALALGRCRLELGDAALADLAFSRVINSADPARRHEARFRHARALRLSGRYEEALALLQASPDPRAREDLLLSLAATGHEVEALAVADSALALKDTTVKWDSVVAVLGRQNPKAASAVVSRLEHDPRATPATRARLWYDDAVRLGASDSAASTARLKAAARAAPGSEAGGQARLMLLQTALRQATSVDQLGGVGDSLEALSHEPVPAATEATALAAELVRLRRLVDSASAGSPQGDLRLFLAAEAARDTLHAPVLASSLFRRLADDWPVSPYAPKAILAAESLQPSDPAAARTRLDSLYHDSPYVALARGEEAPDYRALEDSLQAFAAAQPAARVSGPPRRPGQPVRRPGAGRRPTVDEDDDVPVGRRRPGIGGQPPAADTLDAPAGRRPANGRRPVGGDTTGAPAGGRRPPQ
jgi:tetratricopeptide (TPR) repeat protein